MKKYPVLSASLALCIFLAGCGAKKEPEDVWMGIGPGSDLSAVAERTEYWDLTVEKDGLFDFGLLEKNPEQYNIHFLEDGEFVYALIGTQFAMGEPVQFWSEVSSGGADVYLYRADGSRELLLEGIPSDNASGESGFQMYMDREKNCYFYCTEYIQGNSGYTQAGRIVKMLPTGEIKYANALEQGFIIEDICQTEDGGIYMLLFHYENNEKIIEELDPESGQLLPEHRVELAPGDVYLGSKEGSLAVAGFGDGGYGAWAVDMAAESTSPFLFFNGTSYGWHGSSTLQDFQVLDDGSLDFLWTDMDGQNCFRERLRMEKVEKIPVVLRGIFYADVWLSEQITLFNQTSEDYWVVMETCGYGNDLEDFSRLTSVQIGAGKGPDILCGDNLLHDYLEGMIEKGALEVLNPYMEASGIREEDYFPLVFSSWRQGEDIYSVTPKMEVVYEEMDAAILGSQETPDIEALADALLAWEGSGVYRQRLTSGQLLESMLQGSENLWGMVDWEAGSCDFDIPLFEKLLEVAGRYGYRAGRESEQDITDSINLTYFFGFHSLAEQEEKGVVPVGTLFDDGCHAVSQPLYTMAVNANSAHKEGAWEFLSFLLGEEVQDREEYNLPPVHRESFDKWLEWYLYAMRSLYTKDEILGYEPPYYGTDVSEEKQEEYKRKIEEARLLPIGASSVLSIVLEEAEDYFSGSKSAGETGQLINNRVQLYLNERK